jgi:hypothetical protein
MEKTRPLNMMLLMSDAKIVRNRGGAAACTGLANQVARLRAYRDSVPTRLTHYYNYYERHYAVAGGAKLSFHYADSISRSVRQAETLTAAVADQCIARTGVEEKDYSARNQECTQLQDESGYMNNLSAQLRRDASIRAYGLLGELPLSYYKRAKTSANRQQSVEDYLRFIFLTSSKNSAEAEEAKKFLLAFDSELTTDGVAARM